MKEYPVTSDELWTLGILQGGSALALAFAGTCLGFWVSTKQTLDFADKGVSGATVGWWQGLATASLVVAFLSGAIGVGLIVVSGFKVLKIIKGTDHDD